jgi:proline iminopeptidase
MVDHRGNGRSSWPPAEACTPEAMADDLEALRQLLGLPPLDVLGISFGGVVALQYALRHPAGLRRLVLAVTLTSGSFLAEARENAERRGTPEQIAAADALLSGTFRDVEHQKSGLATLAPLYYHRFDEAYETDAGRTIRNVDVMNWFFGSYAPGYDVRDRLGDIRAPTLVLTGRHDWIAPPSQSEPLVDRIPDVRQVLFEEGGHALQREHNQRFLSVVGDFLDESGTS